jgi:hypothetical protein
MAYQALLIGDSLFTETCKTILAENESVTVVSTAESLPQALTTLTTNQLNLIIVAGSGDQTQAVCGPILSNYPDLPIICADLNHNYVQIITSHRIRANKTALQAAIQSLSIHPQE